MREVAGRSILFDGEGFLWNAEDWSEALAEALASESGLKKLAATHWQVLRFLREFYAENGASAASPTTGCRHRDAVVGPSKVFSPVASSTGPVVSRACQIRRPARDGLER